jgi:hypothetical protein
MPAVLSSYWWKLPTHVVEKALWGGASFFIEASFHLFTFFQPRHNLRSFATFMSAYTTGQSFPWIFCPMLLIFRFLFLFFLILSEGVFTCGRPFPAHLRNIADMKQTWKPAYNPLECKIIVVTITVRWSLRDIRGRGGLWERENVGIATERRLNKNFHIDANAWICAIFIGKAIDSRWLCDVSKPKERKKK